jgi:PleD family two-component response regulator
MHDRRLFTRVYRTFDSRKDTLSRRDRSGSIPTTSLTTDAQRWAAEGAPSMRAFAKDLRVLVIDNDIRAAEYLELLLHASGYLQTRAAYTARAALGIADDFRPAVVLMELDMRDIGGSQLGAALRTRVKLEGVRLIAVTERRNQDAAATAGFARYLLKPITARDLASCFREDANGGR